ILLWSGQISPQDVARHTDHYRYRACIGAPVVRKACVAENEVACLEPCFLAAVIERAAAFGLQQEIVEARGIAHDMVALALDAAIVERQPSKLDRPKLADPQFRIEIAVIPGGEFNMAHPGGVKRPPGGRTPRFGQALCAQTFHRSSSPSPALQWPARSHSSNVLHWSHPRKSMSIRYMVSLDETSSIENACSSGGSGVLVPVPNLTQMARIPNGGAPHPTPALHPVFTTDTLARRSAKPAARQPGEFQ